MRWIIEPSPYFRSATTCLPKRSGTIATCATNTYSSNLATRLRARQEAVQIGDDDAIPTATASSDEMLTLSTVGYFFARLSARLS